LSDQEKTSMASRTQQEIERLVGIMARLRAEGGCPWDREQDLRSLRPYLVEEAFEVLDEMDQVGYGAPWKPYAEELGDLLFQIVFHAQIASELGEFTLADVAQAISDKIERRHPHVFPSAGSGQAQKVTGTEQVLANWAQLKAEERKEKKGHAGSVLDGVPTAAPALLRAERLTEKASRIGFDWPDLKSVRAKLDEELRELDEALASKSRDAIEHELGDVLFSLANLARFAQAPAEDALRQAIRRFVHRFHQVEEGLAKAEIPFGTATLEQMDALWNQAKAREANVPPPKGLPRADVTALEVGAKSLEAVRKFWDAIGPAVGFTQRAAVPGTLRLGNGALDVVYREGGADAQLGLRLAAPSAASVEALRPVLERAGVAVRRDENALTFRDPAGLRWTYSAP
jgi:ATP diphosphatase